MIERKYTKAAAKRMKIVFLVILLISEKTLRSSMQIKAEKVIVTMLANESLNSITEVIKITEPWYKDFQTQIQNVLKLRAHPF
mgnify:CR=1 FL=1